MKAILKFDIQKKRTITLSKLSKLHKKDPILYVTTTFSLKQGETRTNSVSIPHPLIPLVHVSVMLIFSKYVNNLSISLDRSTEIC